MEARRYHMEDLFEYLVFDSIEKIFQTVNTVFERIFKRLEVCQNTMYAATFVFSIVLSMFGSVVKYGLCSLIYYGNQSTSLADYLFTYFFCLYSCLDVCSISSRFPILLTFFLRAQPLSSNSICYFLLVAFLSCIYTDCQPRINLFFLTSCV